MSERARIVIFIVATLLLFAGVSMVIRLATEFDQTRDHASTRTNPWGARAWRELLEACGVGTTTWSRPLTELSEDVHYLVLLDPTEPIESDEKRALVHWVFEGGRLVIAPFAYRGSETIAGRAAHASVEQILRDLGLRTARGGAADARARPDADVPLTADVSSVLVPTDARLQFLEAADRGGAITSLLADAEGLPVAVSVSHGRGRALVLSEAEILGNAILPEADNVVFAANLVFAGGAPESVFFDEYHHGFIGSDGVFSGPEVNVSTFRNTALALLAVALIYAISRGRRFGAPAAKFAGARRSGADYVRALGQAHARAGAARAAASMLAEGLRRRAAAKAGVVTGAPREALAGALGARGLPGDEVAGLLERLEQGDDEMTNAQLVALARQVAHYERML